MSSATQLTQFLERHSGEILVAALPAVSNARLPWSPINEILAGAEYADQESFAGALAQLAGRDALRLGDVLVTPEGQVAASVISAATPPGLWGLDVGYLVSGLQRAAEMQRVEGERRAERQALTVVATFLAGLVILGWLAPKAARRNALR